MKSITQSESVITILFVGSNPASASADNSPFHRSTKSSQTLDEWTRGIQGIKKYANIANEKTDNNRPLKVSEIRANLPRLAIEVSNADRVVAVGRAAAKALTMLGAKFYELPHPSGRNHLLNNPTYIAQKVKNLLEYCSQEGLNTDKLSSN
jgi:uracil-DNA glycosylase